MITLLLLASGTALIAGAMLVSASSAVLATQHDRGPATLGYLIAGLLGTAAVVLLVIAGGRF